jgi:hypothetical protein
MPCRRPLRGPWRSETVERAVRKRLPLATILFPDPARADGPARRGVAEGHAAGCRRPANDNQQRDGLRGGTAAAAAVRGAGGSKMTAERETASAGTRLLAALRKVRAGWLLATFFLGGIVWAHDTVQVYHRLPEVVARHEARIGALEARLCWPDWQARPAGTGRSRTEDGC